MLKDLLATGILSFSSATGVFQLLRICETATLPGFGNKHHFPTTDGKKSSTTSVSHSTMALSAPVKLSTAKFSLPGTESTEHQSLADLNGLDASGFFGKYRSPRSFEAKRVDFSLAWINFIEVQNDTTKRNWNPWSQKNCLVTGFAKLPPYTLLIPKDFNGLKDNSHGWNGQIPALWGLSRPWDWLTQVVAKEPATGTQKTLWIWWLRILWMHNNLALSRLINQGSQLVNSVDAPWHFKAPSWKNLALQQSVAQVGRENQPLKLVRDSKCSVFA